MNKLDKFFQDLLKDTNYSSGTKSIVFAKYRKLRDKIFQKQVMEIEQIEKKNYDDVLDTLDFDGFAEDVILWLNRNRK